MSETISILERGSSIINHKVELPDVAADEASGFEHHVHNKLVSLEIDPPVEEPKGELSANTEQLTKPLNNEDRASRDKLVEVIIKAGSDAILANAALQEIRDKQLWRETHTSFAQFCQDMFGFSEARASQLITAAKEFAELKDQVPPQLLPVTESALRNLRKVKPSQRMQILTLAAEISTLKRPTGASIMQAWQRLDGEAHDAKQKDQKTKPGTVLKAAKAACDLLRKADRREFTIGELADMQEIVKDIKEASEHLDAA